MRIFNKSAIELYAKAYAPARDGLRSWYAVAIEAIWQTPEQVKAQFPKASIIANNRVVFDIAGNPISFSRHTSSFSAHIQSMTALTQPALITQEQIMVKKTVEIELVKNRSKLSPCA